MLRSPQPAHSRKTIGWVNPAGRSTPIRSRAAATAGHESTSGQYPVDWLLTWTTPPSALSALSALWALWALSALAANVISPALSTGSPPAHATCSLRRGASRRRPVVSTTNVKGSAASSGRAASHASRSAAVAITRPVGVPVHRSTGPTYRYTLPSGSGRAGRGVEVVA